MDAYSLDLRKKIVEAKERGTPTADVAKTFGVGASTVKRYAAGEARVPAAGGRREGQRLHGKQDAQAARVEPKKVRWVRASATSS